MNGTKRRVDLTMINEPYLYALVGRDPWQTTDVHKGGGLPIQISGIPMGATDDWAWLFNRKMCERWTGQ